MYYILRMPFKIPNKKIPAVVAKLGNSNIENYFKKCSTNYHTF